MDTPGTWLSLRLLNLLPTLSFSVPPPLLTRPHDPGTRLQHQVLGFESRLALPLAEVRSITLLAAALDLSSSIVIATESNGVTGELMLVFPGRKRRQVEPLEVLLRELAVMAGKEKSAAEAEVEASAASAKPGISI